MKKILLSALAIFLFHSVSAQAPSGIYGLAVKTSPSSTFLGKINTGTGVVTNISASTFGPNYVGTLGTINTKLGRYYFENGSNQFFGVDLVTGNVVTNPAMSNPNASFFDLVAYNCIDSTIYGIARATGPTRYYLAKINSGTGAVTNISAASIGSSSILTPSTLDPKTKRFYYQDGSFAFIGVDMITGNVLTSPVITYTNANTNLFDCFVYNCSDSTIYGLARKNSPAQMYLAKINPATGAVTTISGSSINPNGQTSGGATIDVVNKIFYFQDGNQNLLGLSLITGNIVSNAPVTNANANSYTNFRSTTVCNCFSAPTGIKIEKLEAGVKVFPNPCADRLNIQLHSVADHISAKLFTLTGQLISETQHNLVDSFELNSREIAKGIYFLEVNADGNVSRVKIAKE